MRIINLIKNLAKNKLAYKFEFFGSLIFSILWLLLMVIIWKAIFTFSNLQNIKGFSLQDIIFYYILIEIIRYGFNVNIADNIEQLVRYGNFSSFLIKPISFPLFCFLDDVSEKIILIFSEIIPSFLIFIFLFGLPPFTLLSFSLGILSLTLAYLLRVLLDFLLSTAIFFTKSSYGILDAFHTLQNLINGVMFPLLFLPEKAYSFLLYLPFPYTVYFPALVFLNKANFFVVLISQLFWILFCFILFSFLWKLSFKKIESVGI